MVEGRHRGRREVSVAAARAAATIAIAVCCRAPVAHALERRKQTTHTPDTAARQTDGTVTDKTGASLTHDPACDAKGGYVYLLEDKGYFLPPIADVNIPTDYMRFYPHDPVKYTTDSDSKTRVFWDVGFGEEFFPFGRTNRTKTRAPDGQHWCYAPPDKAERWPTGYAMFIDGDMHMLLDFHADSAPVLDSEFRIGGGFMGRGVPYFTEPRSALSHLSWRLKFFHESTHIGDEYLDDIRRRQFAPRAGDPPPPTGFIHPNVSYLALELLLALDGSFGPERWSSDRKVTRREFYGRVYGGPRRLLSGPYDTGVPFPGLDPGLAVTNPGKRNEGQAGAELYLRITDIDRQGSRPPDYIVFATDWYIRQQYDYEGTIASPRWWSANTMAGVQWGDWADDQMLFRLLLSYYDGINPHGQFRDERLSYLGFTLQIDL
jgi:hypothetical protein